MVQHNFGIWYLKLSSTDTPAMFVKKKYLIQLIFSGNFRRVLDLKWDWSRKLCKPLTYPRSFILHHIELKTPGPSSSDYNKVQGHSTWFHEADRAGHVWTWGGKMHKFGSDWRERSKWMHDAEKMLINIKRQKATNSPDWWLGSRTSSSDAWSSRTVIIKCE